MSRRARPSVESDASGRPAARGSGVAGGQLGCRAGRLLAGSILQGERCHTGQVDPSISLAAKIAGWPNTANFCQLQRGRKLLRLTYRDPWIFV
jgi:hypothetical protein